MTIFITADPHFGHANIIKLCNRPFAGVEMMNEQMIRNWNDRVTNKDTVYVVGDFTLNNADFAYEIIQQLNAKWICIVPGGHDQRWFKRNLDLAPANVYKRITKLPPIVTLKWEKKRFVLCHYPLFSWEQSAHGSYNLHGHSHGMMGHWGNSAENETAKNYGMRLDVGVDVWDFFPVPIETLVEKATEARAEIDQKRQELWGKDNSPVM